MDSTLQLIVCDVSRRGRLRLVGEDRVRFLNGQVTNDVKKLSSGQGCYAALCNGKGRMRSDAVILNSGDSLFLDLEPGLDEAIYAELDRYIIADDVQIENLTPSWAAYSIIGDRASEVVEKLRVFEGVPGNILENKPLMQGGYSAGLVYRSRRSLKPSFDIWCEASRRGSLEGVLRPVLENLGGSFANASALEELRIEAALPRFGAEMTETTLPPEAGIEAEAISYTKGCYLGQEVIARIKSVGHVNRVLVRLELTGPAEVGAALKFQDKEVGKLGSVVDSPHLGRIGLAIIRREAMSPGTELIIDGAKALVVSAFKGAAS